MKNSISKIIACAVVGLGATGCAAIDTAHNAYSAVRTGYSAQAAYHDVKDIKDAQPVFAGFDSVSIYSELAPRDKDYAASIPGAFNDSLVNQVQQLAGVAGARLYVCAPAQQCPGHILTVQFREEAYNGNWAQKITMGSKLKGKLSFVDAASGRVVGEKAVEGVDSYADVLGMIRTSLIGSMSKSFNVPASGAMANVPAVKPGYEKVLSRS